MKKYGMGVSGGIYLIVEANSEEEAEEKVESVCSGEKLLSEVGLPETEETKAILQLKDWVVDTAGEVTE